MLMFIGRNIHAQSTWTTYTNTNYIHDMTVSGYYLWCATDGGVVRWDTRDMTYVKFTTGNGLIQNIVILIDAESNGTVWAGTTEGLSR